MYILSLKPQFLSQRDPKRIIQEVHKGPYDNTPRSLSLSLSLHYRHSLTVSVKQSVEWISFHAGFDTLGVFSSQEMTETTRWGLGALAAGSMQDSEMLNKPRLPICSRCSRLLSFKNSPIINKAWTLSLSLQGAKPEGRWFPLSEDILKTSHISLLFGTRSRLKTFAIDVTVEIVIGQKNHLELTQRPEMKYDLYSSHC